MESKVWAFRVGNFVQDSSSGWSYSIRFNSLKELIEALREKKLSGQVETLAIVAHGDAAGLVQLDRDLNRSTIGSFGNALTNLNDFLMPHGKLIFVSCLAALGQEGTELLIGISKYLPNRHIIGFTINGGMAQEGLPTLPGQVLEAENFMRGMPAKLLKELPTLTEYSNFSKWARNGYITKIPLQEQIKRPNYRCAWSLCPGHAKPTDRCVPAIKGLIKPRPYPG
jgi:Domain of unknown function (DUF4347)